MIRPIVKDAFACDALVVVFETIDVPDKYLDEATPACVNETYDDATLIESARYFLDLTVEHRDVWYVSKEDFGILNREAKQLERFLDKHA